MRITLKNICKSFNGKMIFENASCQINEGDKIGLIGINGVGKTTLIRILMGLEEYDSGILEVTPKDIKIGYLNQSCNFDDNLTINQIFDKLSMAAASTANNGSYSRKLKNSLLTLGFKEKNLTKKFSKLSGGEKTKLSLCLALSENPEILILDEPTNHLDMDTIKWLEDFLNSINKIVLIISHDRLFLDNTVNKIFEMKKDGIREYDGNYSRYKLQIENECKYLMKENENQERKIEELKENIEKRMIWFKKAHKNSESTGCWGNAFKKKKSKKHVNVLKAKRKQLERIQANRVEVPKLDAYASFSMINKNLGTNDKMPRYLVKVNRLNKSFNDKCLFSNAAFNVELGDKIALIGRNGTGKTTLIRIILGRERADSGTVSITPLVNIGYLSQELENLNFNNTILEEVTSIGMDKNLSRRMLGRFLFSGEEVFKKVENLSMGEKCRVAFVKLLLSGINLLILDEPTNHMDIVSREKIEEALKEYEGTLIFVSHDRYLVKSVATKIFEIEHEKIKVYKGDYKYYLESKEEEQKKERIGEGYINIKDEIIRLECEIAFLSGKLGHKNIDELTRAKIEEMFFNTAQRLDEYREKLK